MRQPSSPQTRGEASDFTPSRFASPLERLREPPKPASARQLQLSDPQTPGTSSAQSIDEDQQQPQQSQQLQQQPQQQQPAAGNDDDDDQLDLDNLVQSPDEVIISDNEEMAEDKSVIPPAFTGKPEDGDIWLRHLRNYCTYEEYADQKSLALLKVLLTANAELWLDTLPQTTLTDLGWLAQAFKERHETPELMKFKSAKEIFSRRQQWRKRRRLCSCDSQVSKNSSR